MYVTLSGRLYGDEDKPFGSLILEESSASFPSNSPRKMSVWIEWHMKDGNMPPLKKAIEVDTEELIKAIKILAE